MSYWPFSGVPLGVLTLTVDASTAAGFDVPTGAKFAVLSVATNSVRYRDDGVAPTASTGVLITVTGSQPWTYASQAGLSALAFIATSASATVTASFYG